MEVSAKERRISEGNDGRSKERKMLADSGLWRLFKTSREIEQATATTLVSRADPGDEVGDCQ